MNAPETIELMSTVPASTLDRGARRNAAVLVTGASGEVGQGLLTAMHAAGRRDLVAIDLRGFDDAHRELCRECFVGDICETPLLHRIRRREVARSVRVPATPVSRPSG